MKKEKLKPIQTKNFFFDMCEIYIPEYCRRKYSSSEIIDFIFDSSKLNNVRPNLSMEERRQFALHLFVFANILKRSKSAFYEDIGLYQF